MKNSPLNPGQNSSTHQKVVNPSDKSQEIPNFNLSNTSIKTADLPDKLSHLTDQNLYQLCKNYGHQALHWRKKFIGLLPEVFKRKLYEKKCFDSIFEFAKKLAGLSEEQVKRVLNLERKFESLPILQNLLINGEISVNKLARVASIANAENQEFLATQVHFLSKNAVETLVRDEKLTIRVSKTQNALFEPCFEAQSVPGHTMAPLIQDASNSKLALQLSPEVHQKLLDLQQKGLDLNQILLELLEKREEEIAEKKERIAKKVLQKEEEKAEKIAIIEEFALESIATQSHHVPMKVQKILHEEFGTKCSIKNCQKTATTIHHTQRFSLSGSHNPHYLAPLCKEHHEIAHACDIKYQEIKSHIQ